MHRDCCGVPRSAPAGCVIALRTEPSGSVFAWSHILKIIAYILSSMIACATLPEARAQDRSESLASEMPTTAPIVVAPYTALRGTRDAFRQNSRFDAIPEAERSHVSNGFYLFDEGTEKFVAAGPATSVLVRSVSGAGVEPLETEESGEIHLSREQATSGVTVEVNAKGRYALRSRPSIKFSTQDPPTLAWIDQAIDQYFDVYKRIYAGRLFKMFVGDRSPNCLAFLFMSPSSVTVRSADGTELWKSPTERVVTIFRSDLDSFDRSALLEASSQPARTGACLQSRDK